MSAVKERVKQLIDQLPDEVVLELLEDFEDAIDLEQAIAQSNPEEAIELHEFLRMLKAEGHLAGE
jgi:SMC interacting uncharacterized protein involved in chromosome segregation